MSANLFFISDHHFSHLLMVGLRGLNTPEEMDELMVDSHNKIVRPQDHVYFLGDVAMKKQALQIVRRMNGHKRLIFGNHDIFDYQEYDAVGFKKMMAYRVLDKIIFSHIPIYPDGLTRFHCNVHGHLHENLVMAKPDSMCWVADSSITVGTTITKPDRRYINVCAEKVDYTPISLEDIKKKIP